MYAEQVSVSEDLYHGIGFSSTAHEAVKFPFASRAGIVYGANMFVTSAYGVEEQSRFSWDCVGITAYPAFITVTSIQVLSPSTPSPLNVMLLTRGSVDSVILSLTTRSVEYSVVLGSSGCLSCRKMFQPSPAATPSSCFSGIITWSMMVPP